jgi:hypothetical protein
MLGGSGVQPAPDAFEPVNGLDGEISKERAEEPEAGYYGDQSALASEASAAEDYPLEKRNDDGQKKEDVSEPRRNAKPKAAPVRSDAPEGAIPESLREIQERKDAQANSDAEKLKAPVHDVDAPRRKIQV